MKRWFTSDLHFDHKSIMKFCPETRKYESTDQMNRAIIANWQSQVNPEDQVYILGDMFFCKAEKAVSILQQLPGHKHLIYGNHDKVIQSNSELRSYFTSISNYKEISVDDKDIILFHFPIWEWNKIHRGAYHLYGHVHGRSVVPGRAMDVGIDTRIDNMLWSWEEIDTKLRKLEIRDHH